MNIHTPTSSPTLSGSPKGHFGRNILIAGGAGVVLAAVAVGVLSSPSDRREAASPAVQAPAAIPLSAAEAASSRRATWGYSPHTIYIVASEQQAALVGASISDANAIRSGASELVLTDQVVVSASDAEAAAVIAAHIAANQILLALYGFENRVVDLRG